ncbi:hypothetical protein HX875_31465 [Pseudomonas yamanorum]|uniref:hypothetical protein n=1 Tax=Pseudomonas TaxID=286 RepID=UPI0015A2EEDF|nr:MULTISPECIES: hypothetical protein [Pseudomonas]MCS3421306.1 hypothetical protein [Pseudomonas sp. BIGb0558]MCS3441068.1 hypothetical protein [Pseudomonas sp. BIGb0450]NWE44024.1 hypothetical protein [Pseudomonas yamanorum]
MAQGYINDRTTDYLSLKSRLLTGSSRQLSDQFDALNLHLRQARLVTPGQMVIVPDDYGVACTADDAWLMRHAQEIRRNLELDASAGTAVVNNYDLLQSFLGYSSLGVGSATSAWGRHLDEVQHTLEEVERLHQRLKSGAVNKETFIQQRQMLFRRLDIQLQGAARFGTSLKTNKSLKKVLGISTKSYLHKSEIVGYTQRVRSIAETSRFLGKGTYVGLALDVGVAGLEVKEACMEGREAMCRRAKYVQGGKLVGGVGGAAGGGALGAKLARGLCKVVLGIATRGKGELACGIIGGAAGGYTGGTVGGSLGEMAGDLIYEGEEA